MSNSEQGNVFGEIAVEKGFISNGDLEECISRQEELAEKEGVPEPSIKDILLEAGYVTEEQAEEIEEIRDQVSEQNDIPGYEFHKKLGEGATGAVFKATQLNLDRPVAIKILHPSVIEDETYQKRFNREARSVAKMNHENIIRAYDVGEEDGIYYFVMEYVDGKTLQDRLEEEEHIPEQEALEIGLQMARALAHASEHGLIHRDVKPENIMLSQDGEAKLCDLGFAKTSDSRDSTVTQTDVVIGTPLYMSPEQAAADDLDIRTDIYALGASLYHAVTGVYPFSGEDTASVMRKHVTEDLIPPVERKPEVSERTSAVIEKMMEKDPDDRYQDPDELITDLERIQDGRDPEHAMVDRSASQDKAPDDLDEKVESEVDISKLGNWKGVTAGGAVLVLLITIISYRLVPSGQQGDGRVNRSEEVVRKENQQESGEGEDANATRTETNERKNRSKEVDQKEKRQQSENGRRTKDENSVASKQEPDENDGSTDTSERDVNPHRETFERLKEEAGRVSGDVDRAKKLHGEMTSLMEEVTDSQFKKRIRSFRNEFLAEKAKRYYEEQVTQKVTSNASLSELITAYEQRSAFPEVFISTATWDVVKREKQQAKKQITASLDKTRRQLSELMKKEAFQQAQQIVQQVQDLNLKANDPGYEKWMQIRKNYVSTRTRFERTRLNRSEQLLAEFKKNFRQLYKLSNKSVFDVSSKRANKMINWYVEKISIDSVREEIKGYRSDVQTLNRFQEMLNEKLQLRMQNGEQLEVNRRSGNLVGIEPGVLLVQFNGNRRNVPLSELDIQKRIALARGDDQQLDDKAQMAFGLVSYLAGNFERAKHWFQKLSEPEDTRAVYYLDAFRRWRMPSKQKEVHDLIESLQRAKQAKLTFAVGNILDELTRYKDTDGLNQHSSLIEQSREELPYDLVLYQNRKLYNKRFTWMDSNWSRRVTVTVNGDRVDKKLTRFPVYVDLSMMPTSFFQHVRSPEELRVTTADGQTQLPREIVQLNRTKGTGELHFRVNQLSPDHNQTFHIYYGSENSPGSPDSSYQGEQVWDNGYVLVMHLNEGSGGTAFDSSPAGNNGKLQGNTKQGVSGVLDGGYGFDGKKSRVWISEHSILSSHPYTFQAWVYIRSQKKRQEMVAIHEKVPEIGYNLFEINDRIRFNTPNGHLNSSSEIKLEKWTSVTGTVGPDGTGKLFINGTLQNTKNGLGGIGTKGPNLHGGTRLGADDDNVAGGVFDGLMDEVRISNVERSQAWVQTEFQNQNAPSTFLRISSEQIHPQKK